MTSTSASATQANGRLENIQSQIAPDWSMYSHPLDPLSAEEISLASDLVKKAHMSKRVQFRYVTLLEPPKKDMMVYLDKEAAGEKVEAPPRLAESAYSIFTNEAGWAYKVYEAILNLTTGEMVKETPLPDGIVEALS